MQARKAASIFAIISILSLGPVPSFADEGTIGDYFYGIGTKLGRGILNVATSPAELPCNSYYDAKENSVAGAFTGFFGKGVVLMLQRILVGVSEIGSFVIPAERTIPPVCEGERKL